MVIRLYGSFSQLLVMQDMEDVRLTDIVAKNVHEAFLPAFTHNCGAMSPPLPRPPCQGGRPVVKDYACSFGFHRKSLYFSHAAFKNRFSSSELCSRSTQ